MYFTGKNIIRTVNINSPAKDAALELSLDNPDIDTMLRNHPDLKIYGEPLRPVQRIACNSKGWAEIIAALEVPGLGVLVRNLNIYEKQNAVATSSQFIYGATLEDNPDQPGFVRIIRNDRLIRLVVARLSGLDEPEDMEAKC